MFLYVKIILELCFFVIDHFVLLCLIYMRVCSHTKFLWLIMNHSNLQFRNWDFQFTL